MAQKREPVIQVKNLYKIYRVGENKVRALNGVDSVSYTHLDFLPFFGTGTAPPRESVPFQFQKMEENQGTQSKLPREWRI